MLGSYGIGSILLHLGVLDDPYTLNFPIILFFSNESLPGPDRHSGRSRSWEMMKMVGVCEESITQPMRVGLRLDYSITDSLPTRGRINDNVTYNAGGIIGEFRRSQECPDA